MLIFRYKQTDKHCIIIYISSSLTLCTFTSRWLSSDAEDHDENWRPAPDLGKAVGERADRPAEAADGCSRCDDDDNDAGDDDDYNDDDNNDDGNIDDLGIVYFRIKHEDFFYIENYTFWIGDGALINSS